MALERETRERMKEEEKKIDWFLQRLAEVSFAYPCFSLTCPHLLISTLLSLPLLCTPSVVFHYCLHSCVRSLCRSHSLCSSISNCEVNQSVKTWVDVLWKEVGTKLLTCSSPFLIKERKVSMLVFLKSRHGERQEVARSPLRMMIILTQSKCTSLSVTDASQRSLVNRDGPV